MCCYDLFYRHFSVTLVQNQADIDSNKFAEIPLPKLQSLRQNDDTSVILSTEEQPTGTMLSECQLGIETSPPCDIATLNSLAITEPIENGSECDPLASMATDQVGPVTFGANNGCVKGLKVGDRFIKTLRLTSKQVVTRLAVIVFHLKNRFLHCIICQILEICCVRHCFFLPCNYAGSWVLLSYFYPMFGFLYVILIIDIFFINNLHPNIVILTH